MTGPLARYSLMNGPSSQSRRNPGSRMAVRLTLIGLMLAAGQPGYSEEEPVGSPKSPEGPAKKVAPKLHSLILQPQGVTLRGKDASQQFLVTGTYCDGSERDLTRQCRYSLSDSRRARVDSSGRVFALADGPVHLTAHFGGRSVSTSVGIQASAEARSPNFALDLEGIFTRRGCNSSECHGSVKVVEGSSSRVKPVIPGKIIAGSCEGEPSRFIARSRRVRKLPEFVWMHLSKVCSC